ncbi:MAG: cytochrome c biogenesis protein ResB [Myxococcales bacterium]|nr:cytochrome c biogenesis protein ResB [Myxococcales bacterium]
MPGAGRLLSSWKTSVVVMVAAILYYVLLAGWSYTSPSQVVRNIAQLAPFWAAYLLLLVNAAWCLWKRLPSLAREIGREPVAPGKPDWECPAPIASAAAARATLRRLGYSSWARPDGSAYGTRRRFSALGTFLFHGSFFLIALGFLGSMACRGEIKTWAAVGEELTFAEEQVLSRSGLDAYGLGPAPPRLSVEEVSPEFWRDQLLFTSLEARVRFPDGREARTRINRPLWTGFGTFLRLSGFGYAPRYELRDGQGRLLETAVVKMNVFPPGQRDFFRPQRAPHRAYVEVIPDLDPKGAEPVIRSLNLANPAIRVHLFRGKLDLGERLLRLGEDFEFEGLSVRFPEIRYWGEFSLVHDAGAPILFVGFALALLGLWMKLRGPRAEAIWVGGTLRGWRGSAPPRELLEQEERR